jgi:hypothetical protein
MTTPPNQLLAGQSVIGSSLLSRREVVARLAALGLAVPALSTLTAGTARASPRTTRTPAPEPTGLVHKGVTYDTGTNFVPGYLAGRDEVFVLSREVWRDEYMRREIAAIRDELHCTAVSVFGTELDRLVATATAAAERGLDVWIQPRLCDAPQPELLDHFAEAAGAAEELRRQGADVTFILGAELTLFSSGIIPGKNVVERITTLLSTLHQLPTYNERLNDLLGSATATARAIFGGPVTYGSGTWEAVDWDGFDIVGVDLYRDADNRATYVDDLREYHRHGKPVVITEFGCCSYEGAEDAGGSGSFIVDWEKTPPELKGGYARSEQVQADYITELLGIYEAEGVQGAFVYTFLEENPHSPDPRYDLDMASFGIVKIYPSDSEKPYAATGYWEPKLAFGEIARIYGGDGHASP